MDTSILIFAGSLRKDSYNKCLARHTDRILKELGYTTTLVDISEYDIPLYNQDIEDQGFPEDVTRLQSLWSEHSAFIIVSPEYNASIPGVLKNILDWMSRPNPNLPSDASCFKGKVAGILATSPGRLGGLRGLRPLRELLSYLGTIVLPGDRGFPNANTMFASDTSLEAETEQILQALLSQWGTQMNKWSKE